MKPITESDINRFNVVMVRAKHILDQYVLLGGCEAKPLDATARRQLGEAIRHYQEAIEIAPRVLAPRWMLGKVYQVLGDRERALACFEAAYGLCPDQPDVCREAGLAAMAAGNFPCALRYADEAIELRPNDPGLHANRALALMFVGRDDDARVAVADSLRIAPDDPATHSVEVLVNAVGGGRIPRPQSLQELDQYR